MKTALNAWHVAQGGRMVDFAGWEMPVQYSTITAEHHAVRKAAGLFDIAHMGRLRFSGSDASRCLDYLLTNNVMNLDDGQIRYSLMTNQTGGVLDDVLVYRCSSFYLLVVNASNREKIIDWIKQHQQPFDVKVEDLTSDQFMLAIQGPKALSILNPLVTDDISKLRYYHSCETSVLDEPAVVSRTGYTGEIGFEVILPVESAMRLWETLIEQGTTPGLLAAGLGCRDTLRLEAAMPLYGHELDESTDPFTAGLAFAVKLDAGDFIGREALVTARDNPNLRKRVGLQLEGRRIAREGAGVFSATERIGDVTSGTFSPTFQKPIAMAYVQSEFSEPNRELEIDIRGKRETARIVDLPFYRRT